MEKWMSPTTVLLFWGGLISLLATLLAGFTASGLDGTAGTPGALEFTIYAASATIVFFVALAVWLARHRLRGLKEPPRPASALLLALGVATAWTGLALGTWAADTAVAFGVAALVYEFYPRGKALAKP